MVTFFGVDENDLADRLPSRDQLARVEQFESIDGPSRGARRIRVVTGGGLDLDLHPDRALDIGHVSVHGIPVSWISGSGFAPQGAYEPTGTGWLATFGGGLLATCGLRSSGAPSTDQGEDFGLHGRIGSTPAAVSRVERTADAILVEGTVLEGSVFGERLELCRRLELPLGGTSIRIVDRVRNAGRVPTPLMALYHLNFGLPLVYDGTEVVVPFAEAEPRDPDSAARMDSFARLGAPEHGVVERVVRYGFGGAAPTASIVNARLGLACDIRASETLPHLFEWSWSTAGAYALGVEPATSSALGGRADARATGELAELAPGEERELVVELDFRRL